MMYDNDDCGKGRPGMVDRKKMPRDIFIYFIVRLFYSFSSFSSHFLP